MRRYTKEIDDVRNVTDGLDQVGNSVADAATSMFVTGGIISTIFALVTLIFGSFLNNSFLLTIGLVIGLVVGEVADHVFTNKAMKAGDIMAEEIEYIVSENDSLNTPNRIENELTKFGDACPCIRKQIKQALAQMNELDIIQDTIEKLEEAAYNKACIGELINSYEEVHTYVIQNLQDIITICIGGQAEHRKRLTEGEILDINAELEQNKWKLEKYHELMIKVTRTSIQKSDAFSELGLDASMTAVDNYTMLQNNNDNHPFQTGTR
jgi:hypothetical protein